MRKKTRGKAARPLRLPSVRQLRYFVTLEETCHFGRAAAACFVSQAAFSVAIRELELTLGVQLVERTKRRVTVTPLGSDIATQARLCLRDMEALADLARERGRPLTGALRMGVIPTIAPFLLPAALPKLRHRFPELQLYIREGLTASITAELAEGKLDLALLALPYPLSRTETMPLFEDRFLLAAREGTELVDPRKFSANQLSAQSILLLEEGHCLRDHALSACRLRDRGQLNRFAATSLHTLLEMVDSDLGVTFVPEMALGSGLLKHTRVRTWPLREEGAYRQIALAWRESSARGDEFRQLGEVLRDARPGKVR
jgi:LysR family hydrogen peroxide-inducible transcriptional activator